MLNTESHETILTEILFSVEKGMFACEGREQSPGVANICNNLYVASQTLHTLAKQFKHVKPNATEASKLMIKTLKLVTCPKIQSRAVFE